MPKLCVFDLDGTLVNSLHDIAQAVNRSLTLLGLPDHPVDSYRYMVGEGVPKLCERALGDTHPELVARLSELTRAHYRVNLLATTRPYDGVANVVAALRNAGIPIAVLSNKPHALTQRVVEAFWRPAWFVDVRGYAQESLRKPDPAVFLQICANAHVAPADALMIGDTPTDVHTAANAGAQSIGVTWGFRPRAELEAAGAQRIVDSPAELLEVLRAA